MLKPALTACALVLATATLTLSGYHASAGEILYRWKDDQGHPVHSDRPPPEGIDYEVISTDSSLVREVDSKEGAVPRKLKPSASDSFETMDTRRPDIEKNPEYCQRARENLEALDSSVKIQMRNDQGELRYITEEQRAAEREKALKSIAAHCE